MPTYQYACTECDHRFEAVQAFTDDSLTVCPVCGGPLRKVYGSVGVVFKGSGFYRTDSRAGAKSTVNGSGDKSAGSDKSADKSGEKSTSGDKTGTKAAASSKDSGGSSSGSKPASSSGGNSSSGGAASSSGGSSTSKAAS